ncbi:hypothetical protein VTJ04DRAFT_7493 [Mycothermus thermophilus]|uniref:uncharacterized protein n=1 Tax=Humicola insolens TaxID=85995 RepID=UPI0037431899
MLFRKNNVVIQKVYASHWLSGTKKHHHNTTPLATTLPCNGEEGSLDPNGGRNGRTGHMRKSRQKPNILGAANIKLTCHRPKYAKYLAVLDRQLHKGSRASPFPSPARATCSRIWKLSKAHSRTPQLQIVGGS